MILIRVLFFYLISIREVDVYKVVFVGLSIRFFFKVDRSGEEWGERMCIIYWVIRSFFRYFLVNFFLYVLLDCFIWNFYL